MPDSIPVTDVYGRVVGVREGYPTLVCPAVTVAVSLSAVSLSADRTVLLAPVEALRLAHRLMETAAGLIDHPELDRLCREIFGLSPRDGRVST
jgi:hypothetical protein